MSDLRIVHALWTMFLAREFEARFDEFHFLFLGVRQFQLRREQLTESLRAV